MVNVRRNVMVNLTTLIHVCVAVLGEIGVDRFHVNALLRTISLIRRIGEKVIQ